MFPDLIMLTILTLVAALLASQEEQESRGNNGALVGQGAACISDPGRYRATWITFTVKLAGKNLKQAHGYHCVSLFLPVHSFSIPNAFKGARQLKSHAVRLPLLAAVVHYTHLYPYGAVNLVGIQTWTGAARRGKQIQKVHNPPKIQVMDLHKYRSVGGQRWDRFGQGIAAKRIRALV